MVKIGSKARDLVTGIEGFATARTEWLYGCSRVRIEGPGTSQKDKPQDNWFDEQRVQVVEENAIPSISNVPECDIKLGSKVKDSLTGFAGIAVAKTFWTGGEVTIAIEPDKLHEGKPQEVCSFHASRIELIEVQKPPMSTNANPQAPGGPQDDPKQPVIQRR